MAVTQEQPSGLPLVATAADAGSSSQEQSPSGAVFDPYAPEASNAAAASWAPGPPVPFPISQHAFAQNGNDVYVISGVSNGAVTNFVGRYNATTNVWRARANIPIGSRAPAAAYASGKIYVAAGGDIAGTAFHIYDIASNTWSTGPSRPNISSSFGAAAGAYNGKVYIIGGGSAGATSLVSIYDIAGNTWTTGPTAPSPFSFGGYAQSGQFLYLIGTVPQGSGAYSDVSMRLDMATNTWTTGPAWTPRRVGFGLVAAGSSLFALGGATNSFSFAPSAQVDELDTSTWPAGQWIASPDNLPTARAYNAAFYTTARIGGEIWTTGGAGPPGFTYLADHLFRRVAVPCLGYNVTTTTGSYAPGSTDIGNHCDNCTTHIALPFAVTLYGSIYSTANVASSGNLQFGSFRAVNINTALPAANFQATIFPFWDSWQTNFTSTGIFSSVTGASPFRVSTLEWRVGSFPSGSANFALRFVEDSPDFEVLYGAKSGSVHGGTIGVQQSPTGLFTQYAGPTAQVPPPNTRLLLTPGCCAPIAFRGAIGSNSASYPGVSGVQTGRVFRDATRSGCGSTKSYPSTADSTPRAYDQYSFTNSGPATCVTFSVNTTCTDTATKVLPVAYLGSFNPSNIAANYRGDPGGSPEPYEEFSVDVPANATVVLVVSEVTPGGACGSYDVVVRGLCPLEITSVVSRKTHGATGEHDIALPLQGPPGVECRNTNGNHDLVVTFNSPVTAGTATVTSGIGTAGSPTFYGPNMIIPLYNVANAQSLTIAIDVANNRGQVLPATTLSMNVLIGDTNGDKAVNSGDAQQTRNRSGQTTGAANFRSDYNVDGNINSGDATVVRSRSGQFIP